jgi:hypothetical protein
MRALRWSIAPILVSLLAFPQAVAARGGGGGGGGGFHGGGSHVAFFHGNVVRRPGFVRHQQVARFANRGFFPNQRFANNFNRRFFPNQRFANNLQNGFPAWWGGWGWGYDWPDNGYGYQSVQQAQDAPPQPQVVVIRSDDNGRMTTAEAAPDYGYVQGCHAIPNGYHCDPATQAR